MELLYRSPHHHKISGGDGFFFLPPFFQREKVPEHYHHHRSGLSTSSAATARPPKQSAKGPRGRMNYGGYNQGHAASTVDVLIKLQQQTYNTGPINYPCRISVYKSTGWSSPPAEVLSIDATLTRPETTVRFEHLPLATPLYLNIRGAVTVVTKGQDELCAGLEQYLGSRCEIFVAPAAVLPTSTNTPNFGDGPKRMRRMSSLEQDQSPPHPRQHQQQEHPQAGVGARVGSDRRGAPTRMNRTVSVASSERMEKLSSLENNFNVLRSEFEGLLNEVQQNRNNINKVVMKKSFQMIKINLNRLQEMDIDSVQTVDLKTGKAEAKAMRKKLTRHVQGTIDDIDTVVKKYFQ